jgi:hypothetical protein
MAECSESAGNKRLPLFFSSGLGLLVSVAVDSSGLAVVLGLLIAVTLYLAYGQGDDDNTVANTKYATWNLVGDYKLSKLTDVYAGYVNMDPDAAGASDTDLFTIGLRKKF